ncbi:MAG: hypothetical protein JWN59_1269 [Sphingomonas bacterium]|jgi:uncharacterized short protein YbdD (DUF466 family)|nr:hypothetical protein [Sphingomonas bacterium]MDB5683391.1 hypothetical protein [Sphingomonas bacterium]
MRLRTIIARLRETARLMVGVPRYDVYRQHMRAHHPDRPVMSEVQFFRDRQEARYGGRGGGKCC